MGVGVSFAWSASHYRIGNAAHMGVGYFPLVLGVVLALLGGVITFKALVVETVDGQKLGPIAWRPLVLLVLGHLAFGALVCGLPSLHIPPMGLMAAVFAMTLLCCAARAGTKVTEALALAVLLAFLSYLACVVVLKLPLPIWPTWAAA